MSEKRLHIELFSGCGGLSLGLESAGFELLFANEMSPMAGETFAFNILNENLEEISKQGLIPEKTLWIKSKYDVKNLSQRLRENPHDYHKGRYTDMSGRLGDVKGKLIIGDINHLLDYFKKNPSITLALRKKNIDLISGGPPCQGFSMAGKRIKNDKKNLLPLSFAEFTGLIQPKIVLLENVRGITSPFFEDGKKFYAWLEIAKAFAINGYVPLCMVINSKYFGIPQNRPRFILIGLRKDVFEKLSTKFSQNDSVISILKNSITFFELVIKNSEDLSKISFKDLKLYSIETNPELFDGVLFPEITTNSKNFVTAKDAINDLIDTYQKYDIEFCNNEYAGKLLQFFKPRNSNSIVLNHEPRRHSKQVMSRFRAYQIISRINGFRVDFLKIMKEKDVDKETVDRVYEKIKNEKFYVTDGITSKYITFRNKEEFVSHLKSLNTKKHSQRALKDNEPAFAQLTIPDDVCHYHPKQLRTLTVREMARIQSFPDWYEFRSKVTTGGTNRSFEVPQYTQVGNAVPPILGLALGKTIKNILNRL